MIMVAVLVIARISYRKPPRVVHIQSFVIDGNLVELEAVHAEEKRIFYEIAHRVVSSFDRPLIRRNAAGRFRIVYADDGRQVIGASDV